MKISSYSLTAMAIVCLGGLVSCYPVDPRPRVNPATLPTTPAAKAQAKANAKAEAAKKAERAASKARNNANTGTSNNSNNNSSNSSSSSNSNTDSNTSVNKTTPAVKPATPAVVKFAAPVPGKDGFVFNPYTHNQVDVRGIPSGTKVRDPHDSNPAHIFKVP